MGLAQHLPNFSFAERRSTTMKQSSPSSRKRWPGPAAKRERAGTQSTIVKIMHYLEATFQYQISHQGPSWLVLKPVRELAAEFQCPPSDVIAAIKELRTHGYGFRRLGINGPVVIYDSLAVQ